MTVAERDWKKRSERDKLRAQVPIILKRARDISREMERILVLLSEDSGPSAVRLYESGRTIPAEALGKVEPRCGSL